MKLHEKTIERLGVVYEMCGGRTLSTGVMNHLVTLLEPYGDGAGDEAIMKALARCERELKGHIAPADIIQRIDDGRPGPDEAWALCPSSEADSTVLTDEISAAFELVRTMKDRVAARRSFLATYQRLVMEARWDGAPVRWTPSLGHDPGGRERAIRVAVEHGRLSGERAERLLPGIGSAPAPAVPQLPGKTEPVNVRAIIAEMGLQYPGESK